MQGDPSLGLLEAVVMEFVIDLALLEAVYQIPPHSFGKLTGMNCHLNYREHDQVCNEGVISSSDWSRLGLPS